MVKKCALGVGIAALAAVAPVWADPSYIGVAKCKLCHKVEFTSWEGTAHARGFDRLKPEEQTDPKCLECHATGMSAEMPGVECEACHGPGSDYKSLTVMKDPAAALAAGLILPDAKACERCHTGAPHDQKPFDFETAQAGGIHEFKNPR